jgi:hypothetical protein
VVVLVVVLAVTNAVTVAVLLVRRRAIEASTASDGEMISAPRPAGVTSRTRHVISVEIMNPMELVNNRGRVAGLAGSLVPGLARRVVYDQALKTLRRELETKQVIADVRLHTLREVPRQPASPVSDPAVIDVDEVAAAVVRDEESEWIEQVEVVDLNGEAE